MTGKPRSARLPAKPVEFPPASGDVGEESQASQQTGLTQWATADGRRYVGATLTCSCLPPGCYDPRLSSSIGLHLASLPVRTDGLLRFPQTRCDQAVEDIQRFWTRGDVYRRYGLPHKRGVLLYGPPGSGKSSAVKLILADLISRGGVCLRFSTDPGVVIEAMTMFRTIQPETPLVVLMEDLDSILQTYNESVILNLLDGVEAFDKVCFVATTNYPELLGPRVINRPSRFDRRYHIGHPDGESRRVYFRHLASSPTAADDLAAVGFDPDRWADDTDGMSLAHLRELFVAVVVLDNAYDESLRLLREMCDHVPDSDRDDRAAMGYAASPNGHHADQT